MEGIGDGKDSVLGRIGEFGDSNFRLTPFSSQVKGLQKVGFYYHMVLESNLCQLPHCPSTLLCRRRRRLCIDFLLTEQLPHDDRSSSEVTLGLRVESLDAPQTLVCVHLLEHRLEFCLMCMDCGRIPPACLLCFLCDKQAVATKYLVELGRQTKRHDLDLHLLRIT